MRPAVFDYGHGISAVDSVYDRRMQTAIHLLVEDGRAAVIDTCHTRHHFVIRDSKTGHIFAGDTFGLSYRELDQDGRQFSFPTTSPSQFDPPELHRSIDRMLSYGPEAIYVTHFGRLTILTGLAADLHRLIDAHAALGERHRRAGAERKRLLKEGVSELVLAERARQGWRLPSEKVLEVFALDIELNAQGLESWLDSE